MLPMRGGEKEQAGGQVRALLGSKDSLGKTVIRGSQGAGSPRTQGLHSGYIRYCGWGYSIC